MENITLNGSPVPNCLDFDWCIANHCWELAEDIISSREETACFHEDDSMWEHAQTLRKQLNAAKQYYKLVSVYRRGLMDRDTFISAVSIHNCTI